MTAKLVKTEAVVEGRTEVRWTLVEDDDTPEFEDGERDPPDRRPDAQDHGSGPHDRHGAVHGRRGASGPARGRRPPQSARERQGDVARPRRRAGRARRALRARPRRRPRQRRLDAQRRPRTSPEPRSPPSPPTPPTPRRRRSRRSRRTYEVLGFVSDIDEAFERQDFLVDPTEHERGDPDAALAAADVKVEADLHRTCPAPQLDGAARRRRRLARGRAHAVELDPGHLRRARDRGRGVRARSRARPRDLRVHGRRVRLEVRRRAAGDPRDRALAPDRPARAAREQPPRGEPGRRLPHAGSHGVHDRGVARRAPPGGRGIGRDGHGHRRLGLPRPRAREVGLHLPEPAADGRARPPEPRPVGRLPRPRRDGGHVRLRAGARRAGREARHRPARAAAAEPLRGRPREREALHVEATLGVLRPGGRAGRLGRARRASRRRPHPPRDGRLEPVLVGRRRAARLRRGAGGQGRAARRSPSGSRTSAPAR